MEENKTIFERPGLNTGFSDITAATKGWHNGELIVIAGRPAMGKTALMLSMALNIARQNIPAAIFSLALTKTQMENRLLCNACHIAYVRLKWNYQIEIENPITSKLCKKVKELPIYFDDTSALTIEDLQNKARKLKEEKHVKIIFVDYLELMTSKKRFNSRQEDLSYIVTGLKQLATELDLPVIALSQLSKIDGLERNDIRPMFADCYKVEPIFNLVDTISFIHRPEYYTRLHCGFNDNGQDLRGKAEFIIARHPICDHQIIELGFSKVYYRFEDCAPLMLIDDYYVTKEKYTPIMLCGDNDAVILYLDRIITDTNDGGLFAKIIKVTPAEIDALHSESVSVQTEAEFYKRLMDADIIVIEDIHNLENYPNITNAIYWLINNLFHAQKNVIFTSKFLPLAISGISDRLRSRLKLCKIIEVK